MIETNRRGPSTVLATFRVLVVFEAVTFLVAASLHLGLTLPLDLAVPPFLPVTIAEGPAGLCCAGSVSAIFTRQSWAWSATMPANVFALVGVLLGV